MRALNTARDLRIPTAIIIPRETPATEFLSEISSHVDRIFADNVSPLSPEVADEMQSKILPIPRLVESSNLVVPEFFEGGVSASLILDAAAGVANEDSVAATALRKDVRNLEGRKVLGSTFAARSSESELSTSVPGLSANVPKLGLTSIFENKIVLTSDRPTLLELQLIDQLVIDQQRFLCSYSEHLFNRHPGIQFVSPGDLKFLINSRPLFLWDEYIAWRSSL